MLVILRRTLTACCARRRWSPSLFCGASPGTLSIATKGGSSSGAVLPASLKWAPHSLFPLPGLHRCAPVRRDAASPSAEDQNQGPPPWPCRAFEKHTRVDTGGYSALDSVLVVPPPRRDRMVSIPLSPPHACLLSFRRVWGRVCVSAVQVCRDLNSALSLLCIAEFLSMGDQHAARFLTVTRLAAQGRSW